MRNAIKLAFWFWAGYTMTTQVMPAVFARLEAKSIDEQWEMFNPEGDW